MYCTIESNKQLFELHGCLANGVVLRFCPRSSSPRCTVDCRNMCIVLQSVVYRHLCYILPRLQLDDLLNSTGRESRGVWCSFRMLSSPSRTSSPRKPGRRPSVPSRVRRTGVHGWASFSCVQWRRRLGHSNSTFDHRRRSQLCVNSAESAQWQETKIAGLPYASKEIDPRVGARRRRIVPTWTTREHA